MTGTEFTSKLIELEGSQGTEHEYQMGTSLGHIFMSPEVELEKVNRSDVICGNGAKNTGLKCFKISTDGTEEQFRFVNVSVVIIFHFIHHWFQILNLHNGKHLLRNNSTLDAIKLILKENQRSLIHSFPKIVYKQQNTKLGSTFQYFYYVKSFADTHFLKKVLGDNKKKVESTTRINPPKQS